VNPTKIRMRCITTLTKIRDSTKHKYLLKSLTIHRNMESYSTKATTKVRLKLQMIFPQQCFAISVARNS